MRIKLTRQAGRWLSFQLILLLVAACNPTRESSTEPPPEATRTIESILTEAPIFTETPQPTSPLTPTLTAEPATATVTRTSAPTATTLATEDWRPVAQSSCPVTAVEGVAEEATLTLGPSPGLPPTQAEGKELVVLGTVYDQDCTPLAGATLNVWQTDANGVYGPGHGGDELECCYLQGIVRTDENGRYQLNTVRPGHYQGQQPPPPAHIHVELSGPGSGGKSSAGLMTEIVFADDPYLAENPGDGYLVVAPQAMAGSDGADPYIQAVADFVLILE